METRTVYRVEARDDDTGPFMGEGTDALSDAAGWDPDADTYFHCYERGFPGPRDDAPLARRWSDGDLDDYVCGCRSRRQLARWFPPQLAAYLDEQGYEVTVWNVPREAVAYGHKQVMFDRQLAHCVEQLPVSSLHEA